MVGLSDDQQSEIRGIIDDMQGEIGELRQSAQNLQQKLQGEIKPDYNESAIRDNAEELGDVTGEIAALSALMQAKVDAVFTEEQRAERSEEHTSELQSRPHLVCRLLLEKKRRASYR